jgi:hypothetical protein
MSTSPARAKGFRDEEIDLIVVGWRRRKTLQNAIGKLQGEPASSIQLAAERLQRATERIRADPNGSAIHGLIY